VSKPLNGTVHFLVLFLSFILPHRGFTKYLQRVDLFEACQIVGVWRRVVGERPARKWECGGKVKGERLSKVMGRPRAPKAGWL
jgi:hypothetical protein